MRLCFLGSHNNGRRVSRYYKEKPNFLTSTFLGEIFYKCWMAQSFGKTVWDASIIYNRRKIEKLSADSEALVEFQRKFKQILGEEEGYVPYQIYIYNERGLNFKMLLPKTLASREGKAVAGYKRSKVSITVLCASGSGEYKLPLVCLRKSAEHRACLLYTSRCV